ncbi:tRNA uridine 5-carboxymethylaminomethyl modification enzyme [Mycoplasma haemofelis str. Langford 1]|uniref:tRNA uridine 5-carboxymethylaminomethyl modification enzyme MnmG n=1 Tax=Mycoplasma haemofelis (strain Langford 1) TaxID=941640 RepID=E8ZK72_MYCHL|nr:tRNA uridine-5-carboxymethylaminomethyl(34) synthesis enzyme MnmG [Mycoplasma haemofelis]CBY93543.1 tRNA uridine 5-carboxymethylaminomethyl modification enzyme [Mycoplasma haemofelis str. Langford 1]
MTINKEFDVAVIGAGHAGLEAAFIASKFNLRVALFNLNKESIANLPCNPSIGGPAKGVVTREIDALGGIQAIAADENKIQIKKLNQSKGPGVWAYRAQIDKETFHDWFIKKIEDDPNIELLLEEVVELLKEGDEVKGLRTVNGIYRCKTLIVTTGTYLKAELYREKKFADSGPDNNPASNFLSDTFRNWGIELLRLKTGTPPRVYLDSIDFSQLEVDDSNDGNISFSFREPKKLPLEEQMHCYLAETTPLTKKFVLHHLEECGTYNGSICGTGPRYCPSIEDKYVKFPNREKHFIFVEPIARNYDYCYLAGLSTSLNKDLQEKLLRTIKGFQNVRIKKHAYAIVYDAINPIQLLKTLECKKVKNLFFAGQINGTSGYEEAAAQGLIAGINASLKVLNREPFILRRDEAYIGVMIDDLTTRGVTEPYRLLTSRAEHRLLLRNDNADERLLGLGRELGTIEESFYRDFLKVQEDINFNIDFLKKNYAATYRLAEGNLTLFSWLARGENSYSELSEILGSKLRSLSVEAQEKLMIKVKYEGYIRAQETRINRLEKWRKLSLLKIKDYSDIQNLSREARERLNSERPITVDDALKISGININDIFWIKAYLDSKNNLNSEKK